MTPQLLIPAGVFRTVVVVQGIDDLRLEFLELCAVVRGSVEVSREGVEFLHCLVDVLKDRVMLSMAVEDQRRQWGAHLTQ